MIYVIAYLKAHPGKAADVLAAAQPLIAETRAEDGCIYYELYQKPGEPETLVFVENWSSRVALQAHFETAHIAAFGKATADLVAESRVEVVHPEKVEVV
ncbi:quinol monooxygenase YgiN [Pararhizobium capsulatum DSM 1112]|uniref:Quinol monooxygenase YgiN n=1 Tax=Pararhizobium capsulatum DSM 1112 TaxID=1121113 RepID=A0ABU0BT25_9HYPH|nr:putative quinol monooxygenase [Pararhizobium capsulatum]MDQ0321404.1 quinol monooxygenase YgiN [Pararhizobium capsulatum DSM 1112]